MNKNITKPKLRHIPDEFLYLFHDIYHPIRFVEAPNGRGSDPRAGGLRRGAAELSPSRVWRLGRAPTTGFWKFDGFPIIQVGVNIKPGFINPKRLFNWGGYHLTII